MSMVPPSKGWLPILLETVGRAAGAVMEVRSGARALLKEDGSPVTEADRKSHEIISETLSETGIPIISEESPAIPYSERKRWDSFWLVDPLDGTKEFLGGRGEFTINIALVTQGRPQIGIICCPTVKTSYYGDCSRSLALKFSWGESLPISPRPFPPEGPVVVASRSHFNLETGRFLESIPKHTLLRSGSSLKFCRIAEGSADIYPRLSPTMEWDTAAGEAVLEAAGGRTVDVLGKYLKYNKERLVNPSFIAVGDNGWTRNLEKWNPANGE